MNPPETTAALVARLWRDGPEPGEGLELARRARQRNGDPMLLVFARLAWLCDDAPAVHRPVDLAGVDENGRALAAVVERWERLDPRPASTGEVATGEVASAVRAWGELAQGLAELASGGRDQGRARLVALARDRDAPLRARVVAGWAAAGPEASGRADVAVRVATMEVVAGAAHEAGRADEATRAGLAAALLEVAHGRRGAGYRRLLELAPADVDGGPPWLGDLVDEALAAARRRRDAWSAGVIRRAAGRP